MMSKKNETAETSVEQTKSQALALTDDMAQLYSDHAGEGREDFTSGDFAIPFLGILQKLSPQVDETAAKYIADAKAGMIFNTVSSDVFPALTGVGVKEEGAGIKVVVAAYKKFFVEWRDREEGGGFVAQHLPDSDAHKSATPDPEKPSKLRLPNGNLLVETTYYYVLQVKDDAEPEWAVIAMSSTALKTSRKLNNALNGRKVRIGNEDKAVPIYGQIIQLQTGTEKNNNGQSWYGWTFKALGLNLDANLFKAAVAYREAVEANKVRATAPPTDVPEGSQGGGQSEQAPF
jgi:hypothetical protein